MKMLKILSIIAMIVLSHCYQSKISRKTKKAVKSKSVTQKIDLAEGNWYWIYIYIGDDFSTGKFRADGIWPSDKVPANRINGWWFTFDDSSAVIKDSFKKIATQEGTSASWYIDYRFTGAFWEDTSSSWPGTGKRLFTNMRTRDNVNVQVKFQFEYASAECGTICPNDLIKLKTSLNTLRSNRIGKIGGLKIEAVRQATQTESATTTLANLNKDSTTVDASISAATTSKSTLEVAKTSNTATIATLDTQIADMMTKLEALKQQRQTAVNLNTDYDTKIAAADTEIKSYTAAKTNKTAEITKTTTSLNTAKTAFNTAITTLQTEVGPCKTSLTAATTAFGATPFVKKNIEDKINEIYVSAA